MPNATAAGFDIGCYTMAMRDEFGDAAYSEAEDLVLDALEPAYRELGGVDGWALDEVLEYATGVVLDLGGMK